MSRSFRFALLLALAAPLAPLAAQGRSTISTGALDAAVTATPALSHGGLRSFLATDAARQAAGRLGVDAATLSARVATLDQATLNRWAGQQGINDRVLAGGRDSIIISTTAVIIGLLILILITD